MVFPCRIAWSMHLGCCSTFGKRKNTLAYGSCIFTLSESLANPACMDHAILHGKPFGIPLITVYPLQVSKPRAHSCRSQLFPPVSHFHSLLISLLLFLSLSVTLKILLNIRNSVISRIFLSWQAIVWMRVFSTLVSRSNENKCCMRVDESWLEVNRYQLN
jgi:hypothetical protein